MILSFFQATMPPLLLKTIAGPKEEFDIYAPYEHVRILIDQLLAYGVGGGVLTITRNRDAVKVVISCAPSASSANSTSVLPAVAGRPMSKRMSYEIIRNIGKNPRRAAKAA